MANNNLKELESQAAFLCEVLEEQRKMLIDEPLVVPYDNGGGQSGIRENPKWLAYEKILKSYHANLRAIAVMKDGKGREKQTGIGSPLKNFRNEFGNIRVVKDA